MTPFLRYIALDDPQTSASLWQQISTLRRLGADVGDFPMSRAEMDAELSRLRDAGLVALEGDGWQYLPPKPVKEVKQAMLF